MVPPARRIQLSREIFYAGELDAWIARMAILLGDETTAIVDVRLGRRRRGELLGSAGIDDDQGQDRVKAVLARYAVRRLEETLRQGVDLPAEITVQQDDIPLLRSLLADRTCSYQQREGHDLYCSVAADADAVKVGLRQLAPTSRALCNTCSLPATDYLCSHLHHPRVAAVKRIDEETSVPDDQGGFQIYNAYSRREVQSALCDLDRPEIRDPDQCRPGGNACWERVVEPEIEEPPARPGLLAVPEALDYLALAWKLAFNRPLFRDRSLVMDAALAVIECHSLSELESLLSKLADVFNAIVIANDLLPSGGQPIPRAHSLARLLAALTNALPAEMHADMDRAVGILQAVNAIRTGYQHQERRADLPDAFGTLRLRWPPESPAATWDGTRARVIEAVGIIRDAVRGLESADPAVTSTPQGGASPGR